MAVRVGQPVIPKQLPSDQKLREDVRRDARDTGKPSTGQSTGKSSGTSAGSKALGREGTNAGGKALGREGTNTGGKALGREGTNTGGRALGNEGTSSGAQALKGKDGMDVGGNLGQAGRLNGQGAVQKGSQFQQSARGGYMPADNASSQAAFKRDAPVASTLDREVGEDEDEESAQRRAGREAMEGRAKLRAAVLDRLLLGMKDVHGRLAKFIKNPGRLGVVNLSLVLSESSITYELWKEPSTVPERRERLAQTLGVSNALGDNFLLEALMQEVHQCFVEFDGSRPGQEIRAQYEDVLEIYENKGVLPVMPGFDMGPMQAELKRVGVALEKDFVRSIIIHPRILAVGIDAEDGDEPQVMVAGLPVSQLGTIVAQLRRLNPRLTNRQVLNLMLLASTDLKKGMRRILGKAEVENVQELAKQLLRLQAVEMLQP